ncbi:hypothetical protein VULLAG_LOCUS12524 [Vulpes lagopus]
MRVMSFPPVPVGPERPHPSRTAPPALTVPRIHSGKMQAGGTRHTEQRPGVWGSVSAPCAPWAVLGGTGGSEESQKPF